MAGRVESVVDLAVAIFTFLCQQMDTDQSETELSRSSHVELWAFLRGNNTPGNWSHGLQHKLPDCDQAPGGARDSDSMISPHAIYAILSDSGVRQHKVFLCPLLSAQRSAPIRRLCPTFRRCRSMGSCR